MNVAGGEKYQKIARRVRACDYLVVAQLFLQDDFLLERPLTAEDIKPRLLGHWGTCHGINVAYANLRAYFCPAKSQPSTFEPTSTDVVVNPLSNNPNDLRLINPNSITTKVATGYAREHAEDSTDAACQNFSFILGPGHGFPALQANLFYDGDLIKVDPLATRDSAGIAYICKNFSWPGGFPSHASPLTPGVVCEGGELGYALGAAYGLCLGHPEKTVAIMIGDGELETASALSSLNLVKLAGDHHYNGLVIPILHLNGYKISAPTVYGRKSERELKELIRGFGYTPIAIADDTPETFQKALKEAANFEYPFLILKTEKGATGPASLHGHKVVGNYLSHQIPLPDAKTDPDQLAMLADWLKSYQFSELFDPEKGFIV